MNVPKIMARLNAATASYGAARGGVPEITAQDVAGALGMIENPLARDILIMIWWPDGAERRCVDIEKVIRDALFAEYSERRSAEHSARLQLEIAEGRYAAYRVPNPAVEREKARAVSALAAVKASSWPCVPEKYHLIVRAVLTEIMKPRNCAACAGRGFGTSAEGLRVICKKCEGFGERGATNVWRAEQLQVKERNYTKHWRPVYDWTYNLVVGLERSAAQQLRAQMFGEHEAAA